jgi:hypothetical protein
MVLYFPRLLHRARPMCLDPRARVAAPAVGEPLRRRHGQVDLFVPNWSMDDVPGFRCGIGIYEPGQSKGMGTEEEPGRTVALRSVRRWSGASCGTVAASVAPHPATDLPPALLGRWRRPFLPSLHRLVVCAPRAGKGLLPHGRPESRGELRRVLPQFLVTRLHEHVLQQLREREHWPGPHWAKHLAGFRSRCLSGT